MFIYTWKWLPSRAIIFKSNKHTTRSDVLVGRYVYCARSQNFITQREYAIRKNHALPLRLLFSPDSTSVSFFECVNIFPFFFYVGLNLEIEISFTDYTYLQYYQEKSEANSQNVRKRVKRCQRLITKCFGSCWWRNALVSDKTARCK